MVHGRPKVLGPKKAVSTQQSALSPVTVRLSPLGKEGIHGLSPWGMVGNAVSGLNADWQNALLQCTHVGQEMLVRASHEALAAD